MLINEKQHIINDLQGALTGGIISTCLVFWVNGGAENLGIQPIPKTLRIDGCPYMNITVGELAVSMNYSKEIAYINIQDLAPRE